MSPGNRETVGVVLLNLGGPERVEDVRPFLYNLFSDRLIIRLGPAFLQSPLAWLIAKRRAPKSQGYYRQIGGGSPLNRITAEQCRALAEALSPHGPFRVGMVMRYWHPFAPEVIPGILSQGVRRLVALTLYPHYSIATTGSSLRDLREYLAKEAPGVELVEIEAWPDDEAYVQCLADRVREALQSNPPQLTSPPAGEAGRGGRCAQPRDSVQQGGDFPQGGSSPPPLPSPAGGEGAIWKFTMRGALPWWW